MNAGGFNRGGGFTLLEVMIALAILLIGILGVSVLFPEGLNNARRASQRTITSQTAHSVLGQIRASSAEALFRGQIPLELIQLDDANAIYNFTTTVERLGGAAEVYLQRVTFTVTFSDGRSENFTTFVARR